MSFLTPKQIVAELDKYIVGQAEAKKCVAVALRNRYRRQQLAPEIRDEITPKNIMMIGPTGVGKTEIARRLAKLVNAPFLKVEATKYTEVGYVGRDVEAMVRDLVENSVRMVQAEQREAVAEQAKRLAEERLAEIIVPGERGHGAGKSPVEYLFGGRSPMGGVAAGDSDAAREINEKRNIYREKLRQKELEDAYVEIEVEERTSPVFDVFPGSGMEELGINLQDVLGSMLPPRRKRQRVTVAEARRILTQEEADRLIDFEETKAQAIARAEQEGIIFIDEIDKIAGRGGGAGPDVSREGVQRDLLPLVDGCTVMTKYGPVATGHILFVAAGAFHVNKPGDLIPELQGRFPIRVELQALNQQDLHRILVEPRNSLIKQYMALMATEEIMLTFTENAIAQIAEIAYTVNSEIEDIGARRLATVMERLMQDLLYEVPDISAGEVVITGDTVREKLAGVLANEDLNRYIL